MFGFNYKLIVQKHPVRQQPFEVCIVNGDSACVVVGDDYITGRGNTPNEARVDLMEKIRLYKNANDRRIHALLKAAQL